MPWSIPLGRVKGIAIHVHATFAILLVWVALSHYATHRSLSGAAADVAYVTAIFGIVVLHELGHALTALRFGIKTRDITLLPIGGVARLERMPEEPLHELLIALAGPAVNVAIAAAILTVLWLAGAPLVPAPLGEGGLFAKLAWTNAALAAFNLVPAFPMDGGRVLRALLATTLPFVRATEIAATVGQTFALLMGLLGLLGNPLLVLVAVFVWQGAAREAALVQLKSALSGVPVSEAMIRDFRALAPDDTLGDAAAHYLEGFQHDFPVLEGDVVKGVLLRTDLLAGLARLGRDAPVRAAMRPAFETTEPGEMLEQALERIAACECPAMPVLRGGRVVGMFMPETVGELLGIQGAIRVHDGDAARVAVRG